MQQSRVTEQATTTPETQDAKKRSGCTAGRAMHQNTARQQDDKQATSTRKHFCSPRAQSRPSVTTQYQERFLPPHRHTAIASSSAQRDPHPSLKGTSAEMTTLRSICVTNKWTKQPPKAPQPSESTKYHRRCTSITHNPMRFEADQMASKVEDYTSVYKKDFQAWKVKKRLPYKLADSLTVNQGLVVTDHPSQGVLQVRKPQPFESVTSYRSDYITHPVQPIHRVKPAHPTKGLLSEPAVCLKPRVAWEVNQEICDKASAFFQEFKTWSLEKKFRGKGIARESCPPADDRSVLSTTRGDDTELKCRCAKSGLPSKQKLQAFTKSPRTKNEDAQVME